MVENVNNDLEPDDIIKDTNQHRNSKRDITQAYYRTKHRSNQVLTEIPIDNKVNNYEESNGKHLRNERYVRYDKPKKDHKSITIHENQTKNEQTDVVKVISEKQGQVENKTNMTQDKTRKNYKIKRTHEHIAHNKNTDKNREITEDSTITRYNDNNMLHSVKRNANEENKHHGYNDNNETNRVKSQTSLDNPVFDYGFRSTISQITATLILNFLNFNYGMVVTMPTLLVGTLDTVTALNETRLESPQLILNDQQASWLGK